MELRKIIIGMLFIFFLSGCVSEETISDQIDSIYTDKNEKMNSGFRLYFSDKIENLTSFKLKVVIEDFFGKKIEMIQVEETGSIITSDFNFERLSGKDPSLLMVLNEIFLDDIEIVLIEFEDGSQKEVFEKRIS